ncbi:hypothetical protein L6164_032137 [Bauhinia variegata]|uniref:Uncharacterized protein n=1 Tax=Bauhinia variegata TaxID=167791 RepID=A0ACB9KMX9_BAUVA|nr:hypothetical protein L6164_032137 [Bauhinia variegata]
MYDDDGRPRRTGTWMVKTHLGGIKYQFCGLVQYADLVGITIGYTITASISMTAIKRSDCFHKNGHAIGIGLAIAKVAGGNHPKTGLTGTTIGVDVTSSEKMWNAFQSLGDMAFAYAFAVVLAEIQDTLKSSPTENQTMKKASVVGVATTTLFYMACGVLGYAAFGNKAPGNLLTGFGFYEPFWLVDFANIFIVIHLVGAYQVFAQPVFGLVENKCKQCCPGSNFMAKEYSMAIPVFGTFRWNPFRMIWRTCYVVFTTVLAMLFPFFNSVLSLLGALAFWPLTVYFPVEMYIKRTGIPKFCPTWMGLKLLSGLCFIVSLLAAAGSIQGIISDFKTFQPFKSVS